MSDDQYPAFEGGQTLTAQDLNQLHAFLHQRDRLLGRLTGFGVNCGLGGSVSGTTLTITHGLAVDQSGEPLVLAAAQTIALPPAVSSGVFDFVASRPGGFSVVLETTDTMEPAPDCGEADCEGHAELHTRRVALQVVIGRITGPRFDFADESLLDVEPMRLSITSAPQGSFVTLRDAIVARLTNGGAPLIDPVLVTKLQGTSLAAGDIPGVKGYKAGFINEVLFATLDLLRCEALMEISCQRAARRPGVVLGWVRQVGAEWIWDCEYRHAWEPPTGLTQALMGGTCADPCGLYRDALEGLISGYAPPDPPPSGGGGVIIEPGDIVYCPKGRVRVGGKCLNIRFPPKQIPDKWADNWKIDPRGPRWRPPGIDEIERVGIDIYRGDPLAFLGQGVISTLTTIGATATSAKNALDLVITGLDGTPNVLISTTSQIEKMAGYEATGGVGPADTIVLTADARGVVVATGRVPASFTVRKVGTELPVATTKANQALDATALQQIGLDSVTGKVSGLLGDFAGLKDFRESTGQWRGEVDQTLGRVGTVIEKGVKELVGTRLDDMLGRMTRVEGSVDVLTKVGFKGVERIPQRLDQDFAHGMVEFAETVNAGLTSLVTDDNRKTLARYVAEATRAAATLEVVAAGGDPVDIGDAAVTLMGTLRTAVKAAGINPQLGKQLDAQLNAIKGMLG